MTVERNHLGWLGAVATLMAAGSVLFGCVEAESRFYIAQVCAAEGDSPTSASDVCNGISGAPICDNMGGCTEPVARIDVRLANGITSSLDSTANNNDVETSQILLEYVELELDSEVGSVGWSLAVNGLVPPEEDLVIRLAIGNEEFSDMLNGSTGDLVSSNVSLKFYGHTTGGLSVETPVNYAPITWVRGQ